MSQTNVSESFDIFDRISKYYVSRITGHSLIAPEAIQISVTNKCNLRCTMCRLNKLKDKRELTSPQIRSLIKQARRIGIKQLFLTGGEPFLNKDLPQIIKENNDRYICITTNGTLIDKTLAKKLVDIRLSALVISMDGAKPETHDKIRGVKGCFELTLNGIKNIISERKRRGSKTPRIIISYTIINENCGELFDFLLLAAKVGIDEVHFHPLLVTPQFMKKIEDTKNELWVKKESLKALDSALEKLIELKKSKDEKISKLIGNSLENLELIKKYFGSERTPAMGCYKTFKTIEITPENSIFLCADRVGDLSKKSIEEMLHSDELALERKKLKQCKHHCLHYCATIAAYDLFEDPLQKTAERLLAAVDSALMSDFKTNRAECVIAISGAIQTITTLSFLLDQYLDDADSGKEARGAIKEFAEIKEKFKKKLEDALNLSSASASEHKTSRDGKICPEVKSDRIYARQIKELQRQIKELQRQINAFRDSRVKSDRTYARRIKELQSEIDEFRGSRGYRYILSPLDKTYKAIFRKK